ncbi:MAG: excalibur calcium-binding domain-containing protein [Alphaproteobacteria bacterium]|nr:excalibur calcium-binding domain-containing protein [Alphaproteobacteria bacterium]
MRATAMIILVLAVLIAALPDAAHAKRGNRSSGASASHPTVPDSGRSPGWSGRSFRNCAAARAAGAAPLRRGDPGYAPHLDRDGDGIACEPHRRRR